VSTIHWTKLQQNSVEGTNVEPHHCDEFLIVLQSKQFLPWGQLQRDQGALRNLPISTPLLLNRKSLNKVLLIMRVLNALPPLLFPMMKGKREKEELMQEAHCQNVNPMVHDVAMAEDIFWMFLRAGLKYKSSFTN
jgi:hypothetical protein